MKSFRPLVLVGLAAFAPASFAGLYTDDLSRCLVESSSSADRTTLVRWIFSAMSQHPVISSQTSVTPAAMDKANADAAALFMRLLTEACAAKATPAVKYEGMVAIQAAFQVLGQVAAAEIFGNPAVAGVMAGLEKYVDKSKLEAIAGK